MKKSVAALALLFCASLVSMGQSGKSTLFRQPTMSRTHVVFAYAGDLWIVSREGGQAGRLTTGVGIEREPQFSPDGTLVAFTGEYDGNVDIYVVPAAGGVPRRLTHHPGSDILAGWTPDGKQLLFVSGRDSNSGRYARLFTMPVDGVFPAEVPLPMGFEGAFSPDMTRIAYVPLPRSFQAWKRYRGGTAAPIWIASLADSSIEKMPRDDSNDFSPMWLRDDPQKVYFLSDRNGPITLFAYDTATKRVAQLVSNNGLDIKSASAGPDAIVYERFGTLNLYDIKSRRTRELNIDVAGDMLSVRPKYEKVANRIRGSGLSPTGVRAVFEARGEIITVPKEKGNARNLTGTPGVAERDPSWSPDGKWIAYFSDESGEYSLHLRDQSGLGEVKKISLGDPPSFFYSPTWSPDSKKIAYLDKRQNIWYLNTEAGSPVRIDTLSRGLSVNISWSPDSRWLAYTKPLKSWYSAVFVHSLEDGKNHQITDGLSDAGHPQFDTSGKYIYFSASTDIGPRIFGFDMSSYPHRPTRSVYICVLKKDLPSPVAPESDEEKVQGEKSPDKPAEQEGEKKAEAGSQTPGKPGAAKEPVRVTIDVEGIGQRILALPIPARNIVGLVAGKTGTLFVLEGPPPAPGATGALLHKFDLEKRKLDKVLDSVNSFDLSFNGESMLYRQGENWHIASATQTPKPGEGRIKTDEMEVYVDPRAEWEQMYRETWRIERDFFYDPNHHGLDLKATAARYKPYLDTLQHRADLNYLFTEMLGELSVGHLYVGGGDVPDPKRVPGGLLGADYKIENNRYRFARVFDGENWNPNLRAPLTQPGVNVVAGEYLLAVNGRNLTGSDNVYSFFESTANKQVSIRVGPNPDGSNSREVIVVPVPSESGLRNLAWVEGNRRKVNQMTDGRVAYVYLPDTAQGGYTFFNRYFFSQTDKQAAVIDERFNSGGQAADYVVDYLRKPLMSYWAVRDGEDFRTPFGTILGPKVMIVNEYAGSGGDLLPYMFRRAGVGPLIGKRTWGGLIGIGGYPQLIDGGSVTAPHFAFYTPEGDWQIENRGVSPDIEVELDPKAWRDGRDPQLEKAVSVVLEALKKNPPQIPKRPPYPNYHKPRITTTSGKQ